VWGSARKQTHRCLAVLYAITCFVAGLPAVSPKWKSGRYKYDARHWLGILLTMVAAKTCALFPSFAIACAMCLFKPMRGEYMRVVRHLRFTYPGITAKEISAKPWRYFRGMMRQVCPPPLVIMRGIKDAVEVYSHMTDPDTKRRFLNPDWRTVLKKQLKYVAQGLLSDNPALPLYWEIGKMVSGFVLYRCLRTSSALEGYHAHLVRLVLHAFGAGQDWMDAVMNLFDFRWCVLAGRKAGLYDDAVRHFELELRDALQSALDALPFSAKRQLHKHRSVRAGVPRLRHGSYFSRKSLKDYGAAAATAASIDAPADTAPRRTWHLQATPADIAALLGSHNPTDAAVLVKIALQRGLYWDVEAAQKFIARIALKEAVFLELLKNKFPALHERLRSSRIPTAAQSEDAAVAAEAALPPLLPNAPLQPLALGITVLGGAASVRAADALRPSAEALAVVNAGRGQGSHHGWWPAGSGRGWVCDRRHSVVVADAQAQDQGLPGDCGRGVQQCIQRVQMTPKSRARQDKANAAQQKRKALKKRRLALEQEGAGDGK
jgi:hypothetical protein